MPASASSTSNLRGGEVCSDGVDNDRNALTDAQDPACQVACADANGAGYDDAVCGGTNRNDNAYVPLPHN